MKLQLYTSSFCSACSSTRAVIEEALSLIDDSVMSVSMQEINVASSPDAAEAAHISATPTVIFEDAAGREVFRAEGVPTLTQLLGGLALAL